MEKIKISSIPNYLRFEKFIENILEQSGFKKEKNVQKLEKLDYDFDIICNRNNEKYAFEIKLCRQKEYPYNNHLISIINRMITTANKIKATPVLLISSFIGNETDFDNKKIKIIDISNLVFICKDNESKLNDLLSFIEYSVDNVEPKKPSLDIIIPVDDQNKFDNLYKELESFKNINWHKFEKICFEVLRYIFNDCLTSWEEQKSTNNKLFRFDTVCRIKNDNSNEFWHTIENFFNTKYIVFEYKYYKCKIGQNEIYSTSKYLYNTALRKVAIIIAANGYNKSAELAIQGLLRENEKLIIVLNKDELVNLLSIKKEFGDIGVSDYLMKKLDNIMLKLNK